MGNGFMDFFSSMLPIAGTVGGAMFGGPVGASIGGAAGSMGQQMLSEKGQQGQPQGQGLDIMSILSGLLGGQQKKNPYEGFIPGWSNQNYYQPARNPMIQGVSIPWR